MDIQLSNIYIMDTKKYAHLYGLEKGEHEVELTVIVRTAYIPIPLEGIMARKVAI